MTAPALRVLIVDDEALAREGLRGLLESEADVTIVDECGDGTAAADALRRGDVDVAFLDVEMPGMDGFGVVESLPGDALPVLVFVTAFHCHALRAFDANALDYVVKPFTDDRLRAALARARRQVQERRLAKAGTKLAGLVTLLRTNTPGATSIGAALDDALGKGAPLRHWIDRIPVTSGTRVEYLRVADVVWIGSADYYVELHTADGKSHLVRESMERMAERLDPTRFTRVHRTAIVNLDRVAEIRGDAAERQVVVLRNGVTLPLGRSRREALERALLNR